MAYLGTIVLFIKTCLGLYHVACTPEKGWAVGIFETVLCVVLVGVVLTM